MNYFQNCQTITEAKKLYRQLAAEFHPDVNETDTTAIMQEINAQFDAFKAGEGKLKYEAEQTHFDAEAADFRKIIFELLNIKGITFEVVGSWIWVTKSSREVADALKAVNPKGERFATYKSGRWHKGKGMWYFAPKSYRGGSKSRSFDEIKAKYGATEYAYSDNKVTKA